MPTPADIARLNLAGYALSPGAQRSWWLRDALAAEPGVPCPPLTKDASADVVIVGGGFTGLWTAYFLTEADPNLRIAVLDQDICGRGPSGRNGGFASGWWDELGGLIALYGAEAAVRACRAISESIVSIGEFCEAHGVEFADVLIVDAWGGPIDVSPTHLPAFGSVLRNVHYGLGYTGNGVAPSHLAGRVLADLVTGADSDAVRLPMVNPKLHSFPPQPFRALGAALVRRAIIAKDSADEHGRKPNPLANAIAHLPRKLGYLLGP